MIFENFRPYVSKKELIECGTLFKPSTITVGILNLSSTFLERSYTTYGFSTRTQVSNDLVSSGFSLGSKV